MDILDLVAQRPVVIALAIVGAIVATIGNFALGRSGQPDKKWARFALRLGYAISGASVVLFIVAGFRGG